MKTRVQISLLFILIFVTACLQKPTLPEEYIAPEFLQVNCKVSTFAGTCNAVLSASLTSTAGINEAGFMIGTNETDLTWMPAEIGDSAFSLKLNNLSSSTEFCFYAKAGNGKNEIRSKLLNFSTPAQDKTSDKDDEKDSTSPDSPSTPPEEDKSDKPLPPPVGSGITISDDALLAYLLTLCDTNGDGKIEISEAEQLTTITLCTDNIQTLDGIQYFSEIKELECRGTAWNGKLNALALNANTNLERIDCSYNHISSMSLPYSLKELNCRFNDITNLNLNIVTHLKRLDCFGNKLSNLNLAKLQDLEELICGMNGFSTLDVSANSKLKVLDLSDSPFLNIVYVARGQKIETIIAENKINFKFKD